MIEAGRVAPDRLIRRRISLDEAGPALAGMNEFRHTGVSIINRL